jgi:hypothetical protein
MDSKIRAAVLSCRLAMFDPQKTVVSAARARWHFYWNCYSPQGPLFGFVMSITPHVSAAAVASRSSVLKGAI